MKRGNTNVRTAKSKAIISALALMIGTTPSFSQTVEDTYYSVIASMARFERPTISDAIQIQEAIRSLPPAEELSGNIRGQVGRDLSREEALFFNRLAEAVSDDLSALLESSDDNDDAIKEMLEQLLTPSFGPGGGLFESVQYRNRIESLVNTYAFSRAALGDVPRALRQFDSSVTCPLIEDRSIPVRGSLELLVGLPFAFWNRDMVDETSASLRECGRVGQEFAAALERGRRTILARAEAARGALDWRYAALSTDATPAALAEMGWFEVPRQFDGYQLENSDGQYIFGGDYQQAVQNIVAETIEAMTATISGGSLSTDELANWCAANVPEASINNYRRQVFNGCVSAQRAQITLLNEQARLAEIEIALETLTAEVNRLLAVPKNVDAARENNWLIVSDVSQVVPRGRRDEVLQIMEPYSSFIESVRIEIGREITGRLMQQGADARARMALSSDDCGLPSDIPRLSPLFSLYQDCESIVASMKNDTRANMCRDTFAAAEDPNGLRRARLNHPRIPVGTTAKVEQLFCDPDLLNAGAIARITPTKSWFWNGYEISVDHGDVVVTGRLVSDGEIEGTWSVSDLDMPDINSRAAAEVDLDCFIRPRLCQVGR